MDELGEILDVYADDEFHGKMSDASKKGLRGGPTNLELESQRLLKEEEERVAALSEKERGKLNKEVEI